MDFNILKERFSNIEIITAENTFDKIRVESKDLISVMHFLKNAAEYDFDRLNTIIAVDLGDDFEVIYDLHSTVIGHKGRISVLIERNSSKIHSVVEIYKSAYFDECEIFDLFGIVFDENPNLKRLFMPKGWIGHPLRKDYEQNDTRLAWNGGTCGK